jgi:hypothetical protein
MPDEAKDQNPKAPSGRFASIGGIERRPAQSFQAETPVDLSAAYGKLGKRIFPQPKPEPTDHEPAGSTDIHPSAIPSKE